MIGEPGKQRTGTFGLNARDHGFFRSRPVIRPIRQIVGGHCEPHRASQRVGHLVCGDTEDKRGERPPHVTVSGQRRENRYAHFLRHVVGDVVVTGNPAETRPAVSDDHRPHVLYERFDRIGMALHGKVSQIA